MLDDITSVHGFLATSKGTTNWQLLEGVLGDWKLYGIFRTSAVLCSYDLCSLCGAYVHAVCVRGYIVRAIDSLELYVKIRLNRCVLLLSA